MDMKWTSIIDGDLSGIPQQENLLFTIFDERHHENYVAAGWILEYEGELEVRGVDPWGLNSNETKKVKAWMEFPEPYKPKDCNICAYRKEWTDEFGDNWFECELLQCDVPPNGKLNDCPLNR
nr:MAG TPA: hypothetical protein [Caudoviricetes sp.]